MSPADPELGLRELQILRSAGLVSARGYAAAVSVVRDEAFWARWGRHALLTLGAGQFLAGVVCFFAYNWDDLSDLAKFAVIETALVIAAGGALLIGLDRAFGRVLLVAASVLTGVLLAVIGQVYQTGADVFELFVAWAVLILPWVFVSRSAVHWMLWLVVAEVALALYASQVLVVVSDVTSGEMWVLVGATIALALAGREFAVQYGLSWLSAHWTRLVLLFAATVILFIPAAAHAVDAGRFGSPALCLAAFLLMIIAAAALYWHLWRDFAALVIVIAVADAFFICIGFRLIDEAIGFDFDDAAPALASLGAMIVWAIAGTGSAALAMRRLRGTLQGAPA
ncbi:DUF2157 domain-containing protein [Dongia deserti]|uniref:DUF2157 domain-containing protein n=1 Tax=Dongia deserti TaxID=2268030 RepID=UPI000E65EAE2|nr:DUF2157 domain-containing protein [Dongia deserti]